MARLHTMHNLVLDTTGARGHIVRMHQSEHLTIAQAARLLGTSRWTVQRKIRSGDLAATQLGDGGTAPYLIARADLDALLEAAS